MSIISIEEFNEEFSYLYPELAECICIDEVEPPLEEDN